MKSEFLFIGFLMPQKKSEKIFKEDKYPQIQTHKFITSLIKGLHSSRECNFTYLSSRPVSDYPNYPMKCIKGEENMSNINGKETMIYEIPFINIGLLKIITRFLTGIFYAIKVYNKKLNKKGIIVYSVHVPFMAIGYILSLIYKIDFITVWTDPPSVISERDSTFKNMFRKVEYKFAKFFMGKATKVIALTKDLANDFAPGKPNLIIEGIVDNDDINYNLEGSFSKNKVFKIVYTGSIERRYGIVNLVNGIKQLDEEVVYLDIYGKGDYEEELLQVIKQYSHIRYHGFLTNQEILKVQREADLLINVRPVDEEFVKYSFPSKTLEYMLSGVPVLTTKLPGIPDEYYKYIYSIPNNSADTIVKEIKKIIAFSDFERKQKAKSAMEYAKSKNYNNQGRKIIEFINSVN